MILLHPWWLVPALALLIAYFLLRSSTGDDWWLVIPIPILDYLRGKSDSHRKRHPALLVAALTCAALSSPALESDDAETFRHSQGWIVLADVSRSMTLNDITPSRLSAMRNTALALADNANANSISLIIFSGDAFIVTPPSFDHVTFRQSISLLNHGVVPVEGSNLTRALSLAWSAIEGSNLVNARLFLLSDTGGFNNRSDAAIARLTRLGHRTDVILFGTDDSDSAAPFDLKSANTLAASGGGELLLADGLGQVNLATLDLDSRISNREFLTSAGLTSLRWKNQSHWLLLLALPLMLYLFYRQLR